MKSSLMPSIHAFHKLIVSGIFSACLGKLCLIKMLATRVGIAACLAIPAVTDRFVVTWC